MRIFKTKPTGRPPVPLAERFAAGYTVADSGCWIWKGCLDRDGYGKIRDENRVSQRVHRASYFLKHGVWPSMTIDHLCRNRACVNPDHLEDVSVRENTLRGISRPAVLAAQTHCIHGHLLSGENLYLVRGKWRMCKTCWKQRDREFKERRRAARRGIVILPPSKRPSIEVQA